MKYNNDNYKVDKRFIDWYGTDVYINICNSCVNRIVQPMKLPECNIFGKIPFEFLSAKQSDCPYYKLKPDAVPEEMPYTEEDEKMGKPRPVYEKVPGKLYLKYDEARNGMYYYRVDEEGSEHWLTEEEEKELGKDREKK